MENKNAYLLYVREFEALICRSCQYALTPRGVARHLQRSHRSIPIHIRKDIVKFSDQFTAKEPEEIQSPNTEIEAIDGLKVIDGFACESCNALYGSLLSMKVHCQRTHGWTESKGNNFCTSELNH